MAADPPAPAGWRVLQLTLALLGAAACTTLSFLVALKPNSTGAFAFGALWLTLPHTALAGLMLALQRHGTPVLPWCLAALLVTAGGLYIHVDAIWLHPDAQGAIAVMITPVLQGIAFLLAAPLAWWMGRRHREQAG
jgi:hypothetical protein